MLYYLAFPRKVVGTLNYSDFKSYFKSYCDTKKDLEFPIVAKENTGKYFGVNLGAWLDGAQQMCK